MAWVRKVSAWPYRIIEPRIGYICFTVSLLVLGSTTPYCYEDVCFQKIWISNEGNWTADSTRALVFALGAIGAVYGLFLGARRNKALDSQVEEQVRQINNQTEQVRILKKNQFNESVKQAVDALSDPSPMRQVLGIDMLTSLFENEQAGNDDKQMAARALEVWIREQFRLLPVKRPPSAVYGLEKLTKAAESELKISLDLSKCKFGGASFADLVFDNFNFTECNFSNSEFVDCKFWDANFSKANFSKSNFSNCDISEARFDKVKGLSKACLSGFKYYEDKEPRNLPRHIKLEDIRAYFIRENEDGEIEEVFL